MRHRLPRAESLIKKELSNLIEKEMEFQGILVTITEVSILENLSRAKVGISVYPSDRAGEILEILKKNSFNLQKMLVKKIILRPMPKIFFEIDRGLEQAARIEKLLRNG